jgi:hypothetical protein
MPMRMMLVLMPMILSNAFNVDVYVASDIQNADA